MSATRTTDPIAFLSYASEDNTPPPRGGAVFDLADRLERATQAYVPNFRIVRDKAALEWGRLWPGELEALVDESTVFLPVVSPRYLDSVGCRRELTRFQEYAERIGRQDLILPINFVEVRSPPPSHVGC